MSSLMHRVNWKLLAQSPWPKFSAAFLFLVALYLLACETGVNLKPHAISKYHDVLLTQSSGGLSNLGKSRLVRTLEGNEERYQRMRVARDVYIDKNGGMDLPAFPTPGGLYYVLWDFFYPAYPCMFPTYRVGLIADGGEHSYLSARPRIQLAHKGKWVCGLERVLRSRSKPIVYSLNHHTPSFSSFELDMLSRSPECHIYGFDANTTHDASLKWPWGETEVIDPKWKSRVHFNHFAVADLKAMKYRSLQSVMRSFGHDWIDILKMDLEGSEFATLVSMIADSQDDALPFGQLLLEVHVGWSQDMNTVGHFSQWFNRLERAGLRPFYFEVSMTDVNTLRVEPAVAYSLSGTMTVFPPELVDNILDHSACDRRALKTYSLVSRAWVSRCRSHLFEKCALWPSRITPFWDLLQSPNCTFLTHVRTISNIKHYGPQDYETYNKIAADLGRLTNVCELEMEFTTPYRPEELDTFFRTAFPNITHLVVNLIQTRNPTPFAHMMSLFPALQEVDMRMTSVLEDIPADAVPPRQLRSLLLSERSAGQVLTWLKTAGQLRSLHSLALPCLGGPDIPIVCEALKQVGSELHHLKLVLRGTPEGIKTLTTIDLSLHPNLQTLHIHDGSWFIMNLASPSLEHLTLELDLSRPAYEELDWAALDGFLSPARFPRLRSVVIMCEQHGNHDYDEYYYDEPEEEPEIDFEHEFVRRVLPLLAESELLRTEW
ncbi:Methyltranfer-dom domain-containing protein [Mycena sanguinolenta]|uniref:Methyltranfer-dom domain-containing protein n=1 Tax=Mycena sanguinolenta TaxID=230812 RepID=A0A8H6ZBD3_9AGAR|nr:Methyltranfer-dom domain-containing protein [Mycena sanguinolenta]